MAVNESYHSKVTIIGVLNAEKIAVFALCIYNSIPSPPHLYVGVWDQRGPVPHPHQGRQDQVELHRPHALQVFGSSAGRVEH